MALDSPKKPFSKRFGYHSPPKGITVWEDAPEKLRHFVLDTAVEMGFRPSSLREVICSVLHVRPDPGNWSEYPNVWGEVEGHVYGCEWFKFYDFLERVRQGIESNLISWKCGKQFDDAVNEFFVDEGVGWQLIDG